jgi:lipid-A-disaccharide synthase
VILPFEVEFFSRFHVEAEYFGNPLVDQVSGFLDRFEGPQEWKRKQGLDQKPLIALLPGSRIREIETTLPSMLEAAADHPEHQCVVAGAPAMDRSVYLGHLSGTAAKLVYGETYALLACAEAGLVNSGTATLEAALFELPQVVIYKTSKLAYGIAKRLIKTNFISLVNLIYGRKLVEEIIQKDLTTRTRKELERIVNEAGYREDMRKGYVALKGSLGEPGVSQRIGNRMVELLKAAFE